MKDKDIKQAYNNIKISNKDKDRIFNNIMTKRKKSFSWAPIIVAASLGIYMFLSNSPIDNGILKPNANNNKSSNKGTNTVVAPQPLNRNIALENDYSKEIIVNAKNYLEDNKINVEEIEEGQELVIDADRIINREEYSTCQGNLIVKRYNDDYSYTTSVTCEGTDIDDSKKTEYVIYDGILTNVFEIDDYLAVASTINNKKQGFHLVDCDANFTIFNNKGEEVFNKPIESVYTNEDSTVEVVSANRLYNKYYLILNMKNEINITESGSGSEKNNYYLMILDENGETESVKYLATEDGSRVHIDSYIGGTKDTIYYTGIAYAPDYSFTYAIVKITDSKVELIPYRPTEVKDSDIATHYVITSYYDKYFYGYSYDKSYSGGTHYSAKTLFKMNDKGEIVWDTQVGGNINKVLVYKEYIYT